MEVLILVVMKRFWVILSSSVSAISFGVVEDLSSIKRIL